MSLFGLRCAIGTGTLILLVLLPAEGSLVKVTADRVNLRAGAGGDFEVAGQVCKGDILTAVDHHGDWVRIIPPTNICLWVYGELVKDSVVASKVMVRVGPGINYRVAGVLEKGAQVSVAGTSANAEWLKILAPTNCSLWINSRYVEPLEESISSTGMVISARDRQSQNVVFAPDDRGAPVPTGIWSNIPSGTVEELSEPVFQIPKEISGLKLQPGKEQGTRVEVEGILGPAGLGLSRPTKWRLVKTDRRGHMVSACYLAGSDQRLTPLRKRLLMVSGRRYWIDGVTHPVVVVEQIVTRD